MTQLGYKFLSLTGDEVTGSFWCPGPDPGTVVVVVAQKFRHIRRSRVADRKKGVKAEWVEVR